jgi:hypothetical protein
VVGIPNYYKYQGNITPSKYGLSMIDETSQFGSCIACDTNGTSLVVGAPSLGSGNVVVFSRIIENQYLQENTSTVIPINNFETITQVKVNGIIVTPSLTFNPALQVGTLVQIEGFCINIEQIITAPNISDRGFGGSLAIQNNQIIVGSLNSQIGNQFNKGLVYLYALDSSITSSKIIPISDLVLSTEKFMINNWVISPLDNTLSGLITAININNGYTGISASIINSNLVLTINPKLQTNGITNLGL